MPMNERRKQKKIKEFEPQFYPESDFVSDRRRKIMNPNRRLTKLRHIPDDSIIALLGHRAPGGLYTSIHPPLDELMESFDPIKELIKPTEGAEMGDRLRFIQIVDSFWRPPLAPWLRHKFYSTRFRGVDTVVDDDRTLLEMRERDVEAAAKTLIEMELFDTSRTSLRAISPGGYSHRLDSNDLVFDTRRRYVLDKESGHVVYMKDMFGNILDKPISLGFPIDDSDLRAVDVTWRWDTSTYKSKSEILVVLSRIAENRILGGFRPDLLNFR
ncbi:MAG: coenzyme-B sulfoethylthiotransferase subunit gamma [Candidatus Lokiarchaeota archaeon]|nr:coenzyme-B sulfoethylthiotransferase subunit gamma [Candidatus Lokiarchaeota archaeon]